MAGHPAMEKLPSPGIPVTSVTRPATSSSNSLAHTQHMLQFYSSIVPFATMDPRPAASGASSGSERKQEKVMSVEDKLKVLNMVQYVTPANRSTVQIVYDFDNLVDRAVLAPICTCSNQHKTAVVPYCSTRRRDIQWKEVAIAWMV